MTYRGEKSWCDLLAQCHMPPHSRGISNIVDQLSQHVAEFLDSASNSESINAIKSGNAIQRVSMQSRVSTQFRDLESVNAIQRVKE